MKRISAANTRLYQTYKPFLFWYFALMLVAMCLRRRLEAMGIQFPLVIGVSMLLALAIAWCTRYVMHIADEVDDLGDALVVKLRGRLDRIDLGNIVEVRDRTMKSWPPKIALHLLTPCAFGSVVVFYPVGGGSRFSDGNPVANDLKARVLQIHTAPPRPVA